MSNSNNPDKQKARYCTQFMYRDGTSGWTTIGPYFLFPGVAPSYHVVSMIESTVTAFYEIGILITGIVCDAGSTNRAAFRMMCDTLDINGEFDPQIDHPCIPGVVIALIMDWVHVFKTMRNALYNSQLGGTRKSLLQSKEGFITWEVLKDRMKENLQRHSKSLGPLFQHLWPKTVCITDWTKMRVNLAKKVMSSTTVAELKAWNMTRNVQMVTATTEYIERVVQFFGGLFLFKRVYSLDHELFQNMEDSLSWFMQWKQWTKNQELPKNTFIPQETEFGLKSVYYGLRIWTRQHFRRNPNSYLCPPRTNQNCVESLFGCVKQHFGNNSINYASALCSIIMGNELHHIPNSSYEKDFETHIMNLEKMQEQVEKDIMNDRVPVIEEMEADIEFPPELLAQKSELDMVPEYGPSQLSNVDPSQSSSVDPSQLSNVDSTQLSNVDPSQDPNEEEGMESDDDIYNDYFFSCISVSCEKSIRFQF